MRTPTLRLHHDELIIDGFAGGGGASSGIERALGRSPDIAINHDPEAIAMHAVNHPSTRHLIEDVFDVNPMEACGGRPVGLAWFSPDCTFHSKARGGKPFRDRNRARRRRGLAWVVVKWAKTVRPRIIMCENVEEFADWGPLNEDGQPDPSRRGLTFRRWVGSLKAAGYQVETRELRACDYGAPTIRKRLFIIARSDGLPIVWPRPTHGPGLPRPHRTAAECIEWFHPVRSIFEREKPLAENTLRRIARGIYRFVLNGAEPFVIPVTHAGDTRAHPISEPFRTVTAAHRGEIALVTPSLIQTGYGEREGQAPRSLDIHEPLGTVVAGGAKHALVTAFLAKHYGGHETPGQQLTMPMSTVTTQDHHALVTSFIKRDFGESVGASMRAPAPTVMAGGYGHMGEVRAFLTRYNGTGGAEPLQLPLGTVTTKDRFGLVMVQGAEYAIADIGMRMLVPRECFNAQGFGPGYIIDRGPNGALLTKTAQHRLCGNSVSPDMADALVSANCAESRAEVA